MSLPSPERLKQRWIGRVQPNIRQLTCRVCDYNDDIREYGKLIAMDNFGAGQLIRYKCPKCDVIFGDLRFLDLSKEEIGKDYEDHYSSHNEGDTSITIIRMFEILKLQRDATYLDYACGESKKSLEFLNRSGYNVYGYDKYVRSNYDKFLQSLDNKKFDVIYSNNFIEHVIDPIESFEHILRHLDDNGRLILLSPCWSFAYCYEWTHYHTFFFSEKSLGILCKKLNIKQITSYKVKKMIGNATIYIKIFVKNK